MRNRELFARPNVSSSAIAEENRMAFLNWFGGARFDQHLDAEKTRLTAACRGKIRKHLFLSEVAMMHVSVITSVLVQINVGEYAKVRQSTGIIEVRRGSGLRKLL
ncbi:hypothetical protein MUK42_17225 [Musa troglodytarum]|uniref:Uncharacterized protein n=1 Tax=Musa troglodytarum TaxID=320322 RepID=A0A9E7EVR0_9LILI|nr:hypothetical protein MUK42_17313 [Musa troglodytarum]URD83763.1 hypothetical protein MUK42_17225 [Musa troglodytarum]